MPAADASWRADSPAAARARSIRAPARTRSSSDGAGRGASVMERRIAHTLKYVHILSRLGRPTAQLAVPIGHPGDITSKVLLDTNYLPDTHGQGLGVSPQVCADHAGKAR